MAARRSEVQRGDTEIRPNIRIHSPIEKVTDSWLITHFCCTVYQANTLKLVDFDIKPAMITQFGFPVWPRWIRRKGNERTGFPTNQRSRYSHIASFVVSGFTQLCHQRP
jgi:hypothetical protein